MLFVECNVGDVDRGRTHVLELLLQFEKAIFDLLLDVLGQLLLGADQFGVLGMASLFHHAAPRTLKGLVEFINAPIRHWQLLVLLDLLLSLWRDTVDCRPCRIHFVCHSSRYSSLVPRY